MRDMETQDDLIQRVIGLLNEAADTAREIDPDYSSTAGALRWFVTESHRGVAERLAWTSGLKLWPEHPDAAIIFAMPKSGSTFVHAALAKAIGWKATHTDAALNALGHFDFDADAMNRSLGPKTISRSHSPNTVAVRAFLSNSGAKPIVLVRNIFDAMESAIDHEARKTSGLYGTSYDFSQLDRDKQREIIISAHAMGYVSFFATWSGAKIYRYDQLGVSMIAEMAADLTGSPGAAAEAISWAEDRKGSLRFNIGKPGRGQAFTEEQKARVRLLYDLFPKVDFSPIDPEITTR